MSKINCNIIRDLLPLYTENVVSDDTKNFIEEHLSECETCRNELKNLQLPLKFVIDNDTGALKNIKRKFKLKKINISIITSIIMILLFISGVFIYNQELPVKYSDVIISTEEVSIQGGFKSFQVNLTGNNLEMIRMPSVSTDSNGTTQHYKIVRTSFLRNIFSSENTSISVAMGEYWKEIDRFESTLIIEFEDRTVTYKNGVQID